MKKFLSFFLIVSLIIVFAGCASVAKTSNFQGLNVKGKTPVNYYASNWGVYLIMIPLFTGNPEKATAFLNTTLLKDTVNLDGVAKIISDCAKKDGANELDSIVSKSSSVFMPPFFIIKSASMSANGLK